MYQWYANSDTYYLRETTAEKSVKHYLNLKKIYEKYLKETQNVTEIAESVPCGNKTFSKVPGGSAVEVVHQLIANNNVTSAWKETLQARHSGEYLSNWVGAYYISIAPKKKFLYICGRGDYGLDMNNDKYQIWPQDTDI